MSTTPFPLLQTINDPADLRRLSRADLKVLATELREFVLQSVSQTGGHLSSNLGTVELTVALHHVFSGEDTEAPINMGLMDREKVGAFLRSVVQPEQISEVFVCGPFQMNDEAQAALLAAGVPEERIHIERFGVALSAAGQVGAAVHQAQEGDAERAQITIVRDGLKREFSFSKEMPSILDAASAAGLEVPFSCTSGVCGTCRARLVSGSVQMR